MFRRRPRTRPSRDRGGGSGREREVVRPLEAAGEEGSQNTRQRESCHPPPRLRWTETGKRGHVRCCSNRNVGPRSPCYQRQRVWGHFVGPPMLVRLAFRCIGPPAAMSTTASARGAVAASERAVGRGPRSAQCKAWGRLEPVWTAPALEYVRTLLASPAVSTRRQK